MYALEIDEIEGEIRFETFTPGGPGGQHANRTASAVKAIHIPTGVTAIARDHRSQHRNRELAVQRLLEKLNARRRTIKPRLRTSTPKWVREKRLQNKKRRSQKKELRRKVHLP